MIKKILALHTVLLGLVFLGQGCATIDKMDIPLISNGPTKYSDTPQMLVAEKRKYKRMTKAQMEEEADLQSQAGSLWQMDGQNSFLFAQNKAKREGDALNLKLEGPGFKQVETKVNVIRTLLKEIEAAEKLKRKGGVQQQAPIAGGENSNGGRAPAAETPEKKDDAKADLTDVQNISAKLVERLPDGNYRVKGSQPFMIDKKEFKVIVTGLLRPEDFMEEGVSSNKLLDPQFDVVTLRRNTPDESDVY